MNTNTNTENTNMHVSILNDPKFKVIFGVQHVKKLLNEDGKFSVSIFEKKVDQLNVTFQLSKHAVKCLDIVDTFHTDPKNAPILKKLGLKKLKKTILFDLFQCTEQHFYRLVKVGRNVTDENLQGFIDLNRSVLNNGKTPKLDAFISLVNYSKGEDIFATKNVKTLETITDEEEEKENTKQKKQTENKAEKETKTDENKQVFAFNPLLFGFEDFKGEDVTLKITRSKNKAKPYLVTSNVQTHVLRSMFEKILLEHSRTEKELEAQKEIESEFELTNTHVSNEDADFTTFTSDHIRIAR